MTLSSSDLPIHSAGNSFPTQLVPKSIFASKTVWGIVFTVIAAVAPIVAEKIDDGNFKAKDASQIIVILCGAASAIVGRVEAGSVYTPDFMPGPDKSSFRA
jgi:hypothetical protein